jgi:hypothetical protein
VLGIRGRQNLEHAQRRAQSAMRRSGATNGLLRLVAHDRIEDLVLDAEVDLDMETDRTGDRIAPVART